MIDYMKLVSDFMGKIPDDNKNIVEVLLRLHDDITKIAETVKGTALWNRYQNDSNEFYEKLKQENDTSEGIIKEIWYHFIDRVCYAPTQIHIKTIPILIFPILEDAINSYRNDLKLENKRDGKSKSQKIGV
jgi:hypothetical protein